MSQVSYSRAYDCRPCCSVLSCFTCHIPLAFSISHLSLVKMNLYRADQIFLSDIAFHLHGAAAGKYSAVDVDLLDYEIEPIITTNNTLPRTCGIVVFRMFDLLDVHGANEIL